MRKSDFEKTREMLQNLNNRVLILAEETHRNVSSAFLLLFIGWQNKQE